MAGATREAKTLGGQRSLVSVRTRPLPETLLHYEFNFYVAAGGV